MLPLCRTVVTSDSLVTRDVFYTGNPIKERCTVISRIAPTFLRFGSFEIAKENDPVTGRPGSSPGNLDLIRTLANYTLEMFYPEIWKQDNSMENKYSRMYREVSWLLMSSVLHFISVMPFVCVVRLVFPKNIFPVALLDDNLGIGLSANS